MSTLNVPIKLAVNKLRSTRTEIVNEVSIPLVGAKSAYRIWRDAGNVGTVADFLADLEGPAGPIGPAGPTGPAGPAGATDVNNTNVVAALSANVGAAQQVLGLGNYMTLVASSYVHEQLSASATWTITHNLNRYASVTVTDSAGSVVVGDVTYLSANQLRIHFSAAFAGSAHLN